MNDENQIELQTTHYNQTPRRRAEFIQPPNTLKAKVGNGGLSDTILNKAQALLENNTVDFEPLAEMYLDSLMRGIELAKDAEYGTDDEYIISHMIYPAMQLKANGGMFKFPLITDIGDKLIQFLEVIEQPDIECVEIVLAFHTTMRAVIRGRIHGSGGAEGRALIDALIDACERYFDKHEDNLKI